MSDDKYKMMNGNIANSKIFAVVFLTFSTMSVVFEPSTSGSISFQHGIHLEEIGQFAL